MNGIFPAQESLLTTYGYTKEGCGLMWGVLFGAYPFTLTLFTRLVLNHRLVTWEFQGRALRLGICRYCCIKRLYSSNECIIQNRKSLLRYILPTALL